MTKQFQKIGKCVEWTVNAFRHFFHFICTGKLMPVVIAVFLALITCVRMYFVENQQSNLKEDAWLFFFLDRLNKAKEVELQDTAFFINVSYDIQLVPENPKRPADGYVAITDRQKLLRFLQKIERDSIDYKYILMDVRFEKGYETEYDDSLFAQIQRMPRLVIASHQRNDAGGEYEIADSILLEKCGMSDYNQYAIVTNFSRYTFLQEGKPSIALKMYDDLHHDGTSIKQWRNQPVYYTDRHLCFNSPMMYLSGTVLSFEDYIMQQFAIDEEQMQNGESGVEAETAKLDAKQDRYYFYMNLGGDFVNNEVRKDKKWNGDLENKVIIVANFEDDVHDTYVGKVSGAYITWMAYQYLCNGNHVLSWGFVLLNFFCYVFIFWFLFFINQLTQDSRYADKEIFQHVLTLLRWLGSYFLLYVMTTGLYYFMQFRFNMVVPILVITAQGLMIQCANKYKES